MFGLILIVTVLPSAEVVGSAAARSGDGWVSLGFQPYSERWVGWCRAW